MFCERTSEAALMGSKMCSTRGLSFSWFHSRELFPGFRSDTRLSSVHRRVLCVRLLPLCWIARFVSPYLVQPSQSRHRFLQELIDHQIAKRSPPPSPEFDSLDACAARLRGLVFEAKSRSDGELINVWLSHVSGGLGDWPYQGVRAIMEG